MKVFCAAFLFLHFSFEISWYKNIGAKATSKMLMKWTPGVNIINVLCTTFALVGPKSVKRYWQLDWVLTLWGTTGVKAVSRTLMKLSPVVHCPNFSTSNKCHFWGSWVNCGNCLEPKTKTPWILTRLSMSKYVMHTVFLELWRLLSWELLSALLETDFIDYFYLFLSF